MLTSLCRSSSEWNLLSPQRWTAWATEKWVLPAAQASILDTLRSDCRKRWRQLSDSSWGLWRILADTCNKNKDVTSHRSHDPVFSWLHCVSKSRQVLIKWSHSHSVRKFWRPVILSVICRALFMLKKGFLGGSVGSRDLQTTQGRR